MIWQTKKLGEVVKLVTKGTTPKTYGHEFTDEGIPFLRAEDIKSLIDVQNITHHISRETHDFLNRSKTKAGDVLLTIAGTIGRTAIVTDEMPEMNMNQAVAIIRPKEELDSYFLNLFLRSDVSISQITGGTVGMAIPNFSLTMIKNLEIPLPPLKEQKRIVKILDQKLGAVRSAIALRESALADTEKILSARLREIFAHSTPSNSSGQTSSGQEEVKEEWEEKELGEIVEITSSKRIYKHEYVEIGIPFYRTKEVAELDAGKSITTELFISEERFNEIREKFGAPQAGDILISAIGTIGKIYIVQSQDKFYFKDGNILWFKIPEDINSEFIRFFLKYAIEKMKSLSAGSAYKALPINKLKKFKIPLPNLATQEKIVAELDALSARVRELRALQTDQLADLRRLEKAYLREVFCGEL